jgi:hypothetical protein
MVLGCCTLLHLRKPAKFIELKEVLYKAIKLIAEGNLIAKTRKFHDNGRRKSKLDECNPSKSYC